MHIQGINVRNRVYNYHFENLAMIETKNILIDEQKL